MKANINNSENTNGKPNAKGFTVTPEMLASGEVLCGLAVRFISNRNKENMFSLLSCLRDSNLFVPANVTTDSDNMDIGGKGANPIMFPVKNTITVTPQLYKASDGFVYMPLYTRKENARQEHLKGASLVNMPYENCLQLLEAAQDCTRFVLDPHLYNIVLDEDLIRISKKLPSQLKRTDK